MNTNYTLNEKAGSNSMCKKMYTVHVRMSSFNGCCPSYRYSKRKDYITLLLWAKWDFKTQQAHKKKKDNHTCKRCVSYPLWFFFLFLRKGRRKFTFQNWWILFYWSYVVETVFSKEKPCLFPLDRKKSGWS